ncbi:DUF1648 domain-containing protein [Agromyces sp. H66]|uniref:DUF1648 domain-containing protein n=1 Tax=Agromyces sp. H66 TaxID=2529859 RepID=UPI0010AB3ECD|nr:DUF1648 domain-containing protein [Agromyces sp. H66]
MTEPRTPAARRTTQGSTASERPPAPTKHRVPIRRFIVLAMLVPVVFTIAAVALQLWWLPELPDPVAIHWTPDGPDGFAPAWTLPVLTAVIGLGIPLLMTSSALPGLRNGAWGPSPRLLGAVSPAMSALLAIVTTWSAGVQRGIADAADAPGVEPGLATGLAAAVIVGLVSWFILPGETFPEPGDEAESPEPIALAAGERVVWVRTTAAGAPARIAVLGAVALLVGLAVGLGITTTAPIWPLVILAVLLALLGAATLVFRVRVDERGLAVRSVLGVPTLRVALHDVVSAERVTVHPMAEFGGIGLRSGLDGRFGVVLRAGEALQVTRRDRGPFVVTVDDAAIAAATLMALRRREQSEP